MFIGELSVLNIIRSDNIHSSSCAFVARWRH